MSVAMMAATETIQGAFLDTGSQNTVIGNPQDESYAVSVSKEANLETAKDLIRYRLCGRAFDTLGAATSAFPLLKTSSCRFRQRHSNEHAFHARPGHHALLS